MGVSFGRVCFSPHTKVSAFAAHLQAGRLMGSRCARCGHATFPPRADCPRCLDGGFDFFELSGRGTVSTFTRIVAAPTGFESLVPYTLGIVELEECGRLLAGFGDTIAEAEIRIGMEVQVVPRMVEETDGVKVFYSLERPGTTWPRSAGSL